MFDSHESEVLALGSAVKSRMAATGRSAGSMPTAVSRGSLFPIGRVRYFLSDAQDQRSCEVSVPSWNANKPV
eukprot:COSAG05_NODE_1224_length_5470_cov_4.161140_3_plen_72_part_00